MRLGLIGVLTIGVLAALPTSTRSAQERAIRVFVTTQAPVGGVVDDEYRQRIGSTTDLVGALKKKKGLAIAASAAQADVTLEILGRGEAETDKAPTSAGAASGGAGRSSSKPDTERRLRALMRAGDYQKEFWAGGGIVWRMLAGQIAKDVDLWINQNRENLLAKQPD